MSDTPKVGDKFQTTITGRLKPNQVFPNMHVLGVFEEGVTVEVEILERADDPAKDPVGTVRRFGDTKIQIVWVKTDRDEWQRTPRQDISSRYRDIEMVDANVVGAVPGTPAAKAADPAEPEYYQGCINHRYYRIEGDRVVVLNGHKWTNVAGTDLAASADLIRGSGRWTKLDGKPSDVD